MCCESKDYLFTNFSKKKTFLLTFSIVFSISSLSWPGLMQFLGQNSANVSSAAANAIMMQRLLGTGYELHPLGSRKDNDPMAHIKVWPQPMPKTRFCHRIHRKWSKYAKIIPRRLPAVAKDGTAHSVYTYPPPKGTWSPIFWLDVTKLTRRSLLDVSTATEATAPNRASRLGPLS